MEEFTLKCNNLNCRKRLQGTAYATACSHIFCTSCANRAFSHQLSCPVCHTSLNDKYDIQQMDLNPNETYKSQVLAGLSPEIVQDICFRSISMYMYQVTQEINLQEMMYKQAVQKYKAEKSKMQQFEQNNGHELRELKRRFQSLESSREKDKKTISELQSQLQQKTRICQKLQHMYDMNKQTPVNTQSNRHNSNKSSFKFNSHRSQAPKFSNDTCSIASSVKSPMDILNTPRNSYSPSSTIY
eukprot:NODE_110_length_18645_cov_0.794403.p12 type:complete len:242 gc:universal NODE_110_length_18645_cov_0.794403:6888-6163(-)